MQDCGRPPRGTLEVTIYRYGRVIECARRPNLVVASAATVQSLLLGGTVSGKSIAQVGFGSSLSPAAAGNTGLSSDAYFRPIDAVSYPAPGQVAFAISLGQFEASGLALAEYGLLTGDGTLFARQVRPEALLKDTSLSLSATWTISF